MTTVNDIIEFVNETRGQGLNRDEGIFHGDPAREVRGVTLCWMSTTDAIEFAGRRGDQLIIGHESPFYPYDLAVRPDPPAGWENWTVNRLRRERLERYDLVGLRIHGSMDQICIFDDFAALLGLGEPVAADGFVKVFEVPECSLRQLVARVQEATGLAHLRISAPGGMEQRVHRVGLPWGGLAQFVNVGFQQRLIDRDCDVFIAGESDSYGFRFCAECGIPMIETSHEVSENPGIRHFTEMLASALPDLDAVFYENDTIWRYEDSPAEQ